MRSTRPSRPSPACSTRSCVAEADLLFDVVDALDAVAKETGRSVPQIALAWLLTRPTVASVIVGARNEQQLAQNLGAAGWRLSPPQIDALDRASRRTPIYPYWHQLGFAERNPFPTALG
jgi:aryl-alcohol dehydrogenase-like predicted oxidoreductase